MIPDRRNEYYKSDEELLHAIADAMRAEYRAIVDAGLDVQLDDARLAVTYDRMVPPASFADYRNWVAMNVEAINHALAGIPEERVRYHVCWGSWPGPHVTDVPFKDIVDLVLKVKAGTYLIEGANPRHEHEWRVWEDVKLPEGKALAPGMISHSTNVVEHPELVGAAHRAPGAARRARPGHGEHRLRLRPRAVPPARSPHHHVGEARGAGRGGPDRLESAVLGRNSKSISGSRPQTRSASKTDRFELLSPHRQNVQSAATRSRCSLK